MISKVHGFAGPYPITALCQVGLIKMGNEEQIPLYAHAAFTDASVVHILSTKDRNEQTSNFKRIYSRNVHIHFVGVWYVFTFLFFFFFSPMASDVF
jgi:hypothetical protein